MQPEMNCSAHILGNPEQSESKGFYLHRGMNV